MKMDVKTQIALSIGSLILTLLMTAAWIRYKEKHVKYWFLCFFFLFLSNLALLMTQIAIESGSSMLSSIHYSVYLFSAVFSSYFFLIGTKRYYGKPHTRYHLFYLWIGLMVLLVLSNLPILPLVLTLILFLFMSGFYVMTLNDLFNDTYLASKLTGITVLLLVILMISYPFIQDIELLSWVFMLHGFLGLSLGIFLIILHLLYVHDLEEKEKSKLAYLGFHDHLTGLYNRAFMDQVIQELDQKDKLPISVIMADLNNLKLYNDQFGHDSGDQAIATVASIIRSLTSVTDYPIRRGGDEYIILMPNTPLSDAMACAKNIQLKCFETMIDQTPIELAVGASAKTNQTQSLMNVLRNAEVDMYLDKDRMRRIK